MRFENVLTLQTNPMLVNVFRVSENVNALPLFSWFLNVITVRFFLLIIPTSDHSSYSFPFHLPPPHKKMSEMTSTVSTYIVHSTDYGS